METTSVKVTPKDFFLHLGGIVALYWSTVSFLIVLFQIIDHAYPDALQFYGDPYNGTLRFALASVIIIFPVYLILNWMINKDLHANSALRNLWIRKWLIYITLFIAGLTVVTDLVVLLNTFLGGEITTRFILKVIAILIVAIAIFGYYIYNLRSSIDYKKNKLFAGIAIVVVLAAIVGSFIVIGSPTTARLTKFDERRVQDLQNIQSQVIYYWQQKASLPASLVALNDPLLGNIVPTDPENMSSYEYKVLTDKSFELCATFALENKSVPQMGKPIMVGEMSDNWQHGVGRTCFTRVIDPTLIPPVKR